LPASQKARSSGRSAKVDSCVRNEVSQGQRPGGDRRRRRSGAPGDRGGVPGEISSAR